MTGEQSVQQSRGLQCTLIHKCVCGHLRLGNTVCKCRREKITQNDTFLLYIRKTNYFRPPYSSTTYWTLSHGWSAIFTTTKMYTCTLALNVNKIKRGGFVNINLAFKSSNRCLATSMYMICNIIYWLIGSQ